MASHTLSLLLPMFVLTLTSLLLIISHSDACHVVDKQALLHFKSKITADPTKRIDSWTSSSDCCQDWDGVACDSFTGRVVSLDLKPNMGNQGREMSGTLSPYLGNLTYLQVLDLGYLKKLTGPIPEELGNLSELKTLNLVFNEFTGGIPISLGKLPKLEFLHLDGNHLSGNLNSSLIESLKSIVELGLALNNLSGEIPSSIGSLKSLLVLDLRNNTFDGSIPSSIGNLKQLGLLFLSDNQISGRIPESFSNLSRLDFVDLSRNRLVGRIPSNLADMPVSSFVGNAGLCGPPLLPCSNHF